VSRRLPSHSALEAPRERVGPRKGKDFEGTREPEERDGYQSAQQQWSAEPLRLCEQRREARLVLVIVGRPDPGALGRGRRIGRAAGDGRRTESLLAR
jgi:hypothetical protein